MLIRKYKFIISVFMLLFIFVFAVYLQDFYHEKNKQQEEILREALLNGKSKFLMPGGSSAGGLYSNEFKIDNEFYLNIFQSESKFVNSNYFFSIRSQILLKIIVRYEQEEFVFSIQQSGPTYIVFNGKKLILFEKNKEFLCEKALESYSNLKLDQENYNIVVKRLAQLKRY